MKRLIILIIVFLTNLLIIQAQTHYVIALDCTRSMDHPDAFYDGDYSDDARAPHKIWEPAKNAVRDIFYAALPNDRFTIILFQNRVLDCCDADKSQLTWEIINTRMETAIKNPYNTCILSAWKKAEEYFSKSTNSVFYLITDGVEDHGDSGEIASRHTDELCEKIKTFCTTHSNTQGFYTNLVLSLHNRNNNAITKALEESSCFKTKVGGRFDDKIVVDIDENKRNFVQRVSLIFHPTDKLPVNLKNIQILSNNPYFDVTPVSGDIINNRLDVEINCKNIVPANLCNGDNYSFPIEVLSSMTEKHQIYNQKVNIYANFKLSSVVFLPNQPLIAEAIYQKPFKLLERFFPTIAAEKEPQIIKFDFLELIKESGISVMFNDEACLKGAEVHLKLNDKKGQSLPIINLSYNGKKCANSFIIKSTDSMSLLEIEFDKSATPKRYSQLYLSVDKVINVDRINSLPNANDYTIDLELTYQVKENPWYITAICVIVLISLIILLWIIIANFPSRKMFGMLMVDNNYPITIQGKVKCIMTSKAKQQSLISKLFKGPIVYSTPNSYWISDLIISRGRNFNMIDIYPSQDYLIDGMIRTIPYAVIKGNSFVLENIKTKEKRTINFL